MMKPEIKYFRNLDSWDNFQEWYDNFVATCGGTGLRNHTDFEYEPPEDERTYFDGLDRWLYVIQKARLHITEGIDILRQEKGKLSGRKVLFRLWKQSLSSAVADLTSEQRLINITNMSLDTSWNKSALSFINKFLKEVEIYNSNCATTKEEISMEMRMILLQRAVSNVKPLADVKARERHAIAEGKGKYSLQTCVDLLKDEASRIDRLRTKARIKKETIGRRINNSRRPARRVNHSEHGQDEDTDDDHENDDVADDEGSRDSYQGLLEVFKVVMANQTERMDSESFGKLSPAGRKLWLQLTKEDRATMLKSQPESPRSVNRTELSSTDKDTPEETTTPPSQEDGKSLDVNVTETQSSTKSRAHPVDIRRSLSKAASKKEGTQSRTVTNVTWSSVLEETDRDVLQELGELEDDDIPPNDDPFDEDDSDSQQGNWPAFEGGIGDYWNDSSSEEDF